MKILALEFSSSQRSAAIVETGAAAVPRSISEAIETGARASRAVELVDTILREAGMTPDRVDSIAVGLGPGSYTGVRAAMAFAQGWHLARHVPVIGVGSVECLAWQARAEGRTGRLDVVLDALRGEVYHAAFEITSGHLREIVPLRLAALDEIRRLEHDGAWFVGPEIHRWFPSGRILFPRAATLGTLAAGREAAVPPNELEPLYLRETTFRKSVSARPE